MTKDDINKKIEEMGFDENFLLADGFEEAFMGIVGGSTGSSQSYKTCYDADKCIEILEREMSNEEAVEYFEFNTLGAYVGECTPMFIWRHEEK